MTLFGLYVCDFKETECCVSRTAKLFFLHLSTFHSAFLVSSPVSFHLLFRSLYKVMYNYQSAVLNTAASFGQSSDSPRLLNSDSCINCLLFLWNCIMVHLSEIRHTYPSFLYYSLQRASALYRVPSTPAYPHPVRTVHDVLFQKKSLSTVQTRSHIYATPGRFWNT